MAVAGAPVGQAPPHVPLPDRLGCRVPGLPRPRLEIAGTGDADPLDFELDAKRLTMRNTEALVLVGAGPQGVVYMKSDERALAEQRP